MNNTIQRPYIRKRYFINRKLQGRFVIYFLILCSSIPAVTGILIWRFSQQELSDFIFSAHFAVITPWGVVFPIMIKVIAGAILVFLTASYILAHLIIKRISTRLESFSDVLRNIGRGNLNVEVPQDALDELKEPLRIFIKNMREDIGLLRTIKSLIENAGKTVEGEEAVLKDMERLSMAFKEKLSECQIRL